jgi:hypothetical protein
MIIEVLCGVHGKNLGVNVDPVRPMVARVDGGIRFENVSRIGHGENLGGNVDPVRPTVVHVDGGIRFKNVSSIGQAERSIFWEIVFFAKIVIEQAHLIRMVTRLLLLDLEKILWLAPLMLSQSRDCIISSRMSGIENAEKRTPASC